MRPKKGNSSSPMFKKYRLKKMQVTKIKPRETHHPRGKQINIIQNITSVKITLMFQ